MANQEAVDIARRIKDPQKAAKQLVVESLNRESKDDISCIVVRFKGWTRETNTTQLLPTFSWYIFYQYALPFVWRSREIHFLQHRFCSFLCKIEVLQIRWCHFSISRFVLCRLLPSFFFVICIITWSSVKMDIDIAFTFEWVMRLLQTQFTNYLKCPTPNA